MCEAWEGGGGGACQFSSNARARPDAARPHPLPPLPARPCREFGLWQMDPPEYYAGHFLTYRNNVREVVEQVKHERYNGSMPFFLQNWVGAAYQLATLRCGGEKRACRVHTAMTARAP